MTPARVPTLYLNWKNGKSIGLVNSVWEASVKTTGCDLTRCNFSTLVSLFRRFGYILFSGPFSYHLKVDSLYLCRRFLLRWFVKMVINPGFSPSSASRLFSRSRISIPQLSLRIMRHYSYSIDSWAERW